MDSGNLTNSLTVGAVIIQLLGGLALFLYGMEQMTTALKLVAGSRMKSLLAKLTTNRFKGVLVGIVVTAIFQSSSVTAVMLVGFISAGLMALPQSVGVLLGAGIGGTVTAQIVAFKVTRSALGLVSLGFLLLFVAKNKPIRQYGAMVMGLGLVFFGMNIMGEATRPLSNVDSFLALMRWLENPLLGLLLGLVFTALIQSATATVGLVMALASQGFLSLEAGLGLMFGAHIGAAVTPLLASIGRPREAVQAAVLNLLYRSAGVLIWLFFTGQLAAMARFMAPTHPGLTGLARIAAEAPRQIANAYTIFNVGNAFIFIWFTTPLVTLINRLIPLRPQPRAAVATPRYLDDTLFQTPGIALDRVRLELGRLGSYAGQMVRIALPTVFHGSEAELAAMAAMDDNVDLLYGAIVTYLGRLSQVNLGPRESSELAECMAVANHLENIGDMVETNLVEAGHTRLQQQVEMSQVTQQILLALHAKVCWSVEKSVEALVTANRPLAEEVIAAKLEVNRLADEAEEHLVHRLTAAEPNRLDTFRIETEIIEYLKRVYYFAKRVAKAATETATEFRPLPLPPALEEPVAG